MPGLKIGLIPRIALALTLVGLVPLVAASVPLIGINREAMQDQVLQTHSMAARTAAGRVASYLTALGSTAEAAAGNPVLAADPRSPAAQQLLAGILEARPDVAALAVVNETGELVIRVQRKGRGEEVAEALAARPAAGPEGGGAPALLEAAGRRWLLLSRPLGQARGRLLLLAGIEPLAAAVEAFELGHGEADLVLATAGEEVVAGTAPSLAAFPEPQVAAARSLKVAGAGPYQGAGGEQVLGAFAPVAGSDWFVLSRQPTAVAQRVERRMVRRSWTALGLALVLVGLLSLTAHATLVRPIRRLAEAQRRLAGLEESPGGGNEIDQLRSSFEVLERRLRDQQELGQVFLGRFQVLELIGEGAMGTVFLGWDPRLQRRVALKTIRLTTDLASSVRRRLSSQLMREATAAARFNHPHIVAVYDVEDTPEVAFMAMEYVEGIGLDHLLSRVPMLSEKQALSLGLAVARALAAAHQHDLVHRDIKPSNVLLGYDGAIKVADFGIADFISAMTPESDTVFGTPGYLAPEVLLGEGFSPRSDLFSLGVILYESLTGYHPFFATSLREMAIRTVNHNPEPVRRLCPEVSSELESLVSQLLAKHPEARPPGAQAVIERIESMVLASKVRWDPSVLPRLRQRSPREVGLRSRLLPTLASGPDHRRKP